MAYDKNRRRPPREDDGTLIEGRNAVLETLRAGRTVDKVFVADGARIGDVAAEARRHGVPVVTCDRRKLDQHELDGNHQGVIAQAAAQEYVSLESIFQVAHERGEPPLIVVCDGIEDPHNLGAIIRSAETAGAHGVIIPKRRAGRTDRRGRTRQQRVCAGVYRRAQGKKPRRYAGRTEGTRRVAVRRRGGWQRPAV